MKLPNFNLFKRSFISLVITPSQVKVVKVNTKSNKVTKFAQADVPPGIIVNYRVKDKDALVKIIKDLWSKNHISERYVGVVVPEFSTYPKTFVLPNLTDVEIDEALKWRLQEYLPTPLEEVTFDWKMIKRDKKEAHVLVVAILKDVLYGYIDSVGSAGLSPLVVETPSLSIHRIIGEWQVGKLIIYMSAQEAILIVTNGPEIIASSVVASEDFNVVVRTAQQMLTHYSSVNIEKIVISGVGLSQDLVQFLNYNLGRPVSFANTNVKGMLPGQLQDFLVGISLQYKNPVEPRSELTINLLPPDWAEFYKEQHQGFQTWTLTLIISIVIWTAFLSVFMAFTFFSLQLNDLKNNPVNEQTQELNKVVTQVTSINKTADTIITATSTMVDPQKVANLLTSIRVGGVTINKFTIDYESGEIDMSGTAATRDNLLEYKNKLDADENFANIDLPLESLVQEADISFAIRMTDKKLVKPVKAPAKLKLQ